MVNNQRQKRSATTDPYDTRYQFEFMDDFKGMTQNKQNLWILIK